MSGKVKFISRARKAKLLKQLSEAIEGTPEAKAIREQLGAHAPIDPAVEEAKKKAAQEAAEAAQKKLEEENKKAEAEKKIKEEAKRKAELEKKKKAEAARKKKKVSKQTKASE